MDFGGPVTLAAAATNRAEPWRLGAHNASRATVPAMWWMAKQRKCREATRGVVNDFRSAFAPYLADGRLARAMHADPYVLGYIVARLHGLAQCACETQGVLEEMAQVVDSAGGAVFGTRYGALRDTMLCAALLPEDGAYGEGLRDGRAHGAGADDAYADGEHAGPRQRRSADAAGDITEAAALARVRRVGFAPSPAEHAAPARYFAQRHPG